MRRLIMLALLVAGLAAIVALPAVAKPRGVNGKLLVNADSTTGTQPVYIVNPDGSGRQLLFDNAEAGKWSPDGRRIALTLRSEERRVGKECRSRWAAHHEKTKKKIDQQ